MLYNEGIGDNGVISMRVFCSYLISPSFQIVQPKCLSFRIKITIRLNWTHGSFYSDLSVRSSVRRFRNQIPVITISPERFGFNYCNLVYRLLMSVTQHTQIHQNLTDKYNSILFPTQFVLHSCHD